MKGFPEGRGYAAVDTVFLLIAARLERAKGCGDNPYFTTVHTLLPDIANLLLCTKPEIEKQRIGEVVKSRNIRRLKMSVKNLLVELEIFVLFTPKFYMFDHIVEDVSGFVSLNF